jgi:hypothetical protein
MIKGREKAIIKQEIGEVLQQSTAKEITWQLFDWSLSNLKNYECLN